MHPDPAHLPPVHHPPLPACSCPSSCNVEDYTNLVQMEHCRLAGLYDLNQSNPWVAQQLLQWITNITETYAVDGLRLDTVPYVWPTFWTQFQASADMVRACRRQAAWRGAPVALRARAATAASRPVDAAAGGCSTSWARWTPAT